MRAGRNDAQILMNGNVFVGVCLGWDWCAEHEWGIKGLTLAFDIPEPGKLLGFEARKIRENPKNLELLERGDAMLLTYSCLRDWYSPDVDVPSFIDEAVCSDHYDKTKDLLCSWDERSFGIRVLGEENRKHLQELYDAFKKKDVVIFLGGNSNPFSNAGLKICIYSRLPAEAVESAVEQDKSAIRLKATAEATGILQRLEASGRCGYFACSPRWVGEETRKRTKHDVVFWLNPSDQRNNNFGWFTVEELDQWIAGEGPIPKK